MATQTSSINATIEAASARWGRNHCRSVTTVADVAGSLNATYFDLNYVDYEFNEVQAYVYLNVDPAIAGKTGISATVMSGDSADAVATAIKAGIDAADLPFIVSVSGSVLTIENQVIGNITAEADSGSTGFTFSVLQDGLGVDLGATSDAINLTLETSTVVINSNQKGQTPLDELVNGQQASITMSLIEVTKERFDTLVGEVTGGNVTPMSGTKVSGFGEASLHKSLSKLGGTLILHPIRLAESDKSNDLVFFRSAPKVSGLSFDGQNPQALELEFTAYLDSNFNKEINLFIKGDWTQKGLRA